MKRMPVGLRLFKILLAQDEKLKIMELKNDHPSPRNRILLKISAILWVIWGIVHAFAGVITISSDTASAVAGIADGVDPILLAVEYPDGAGAIINQHGFNLLWGGVVTIIGGIFIWRNSVAAIFVSALVGGLLDIGYFIFIDLGGYNNFVPGTVMTIISASAIVLSFYAHFSGRKR